MVSESSDWGDPSAVNLTFARAWW